MKPFKFTPSEYQTAKYILENQGLDRFGNALYPPSFVTWACKVYKWWQRFYQVMKRYAKIIGSLALATKAVWDNIKQGISLPNMLRQLANPVGFVPLEKVWQKPRFSRGETARNGQAITYINPKTSKHTRRIKCTNIANNLQSC